MTGPRKRTSPLLGTLSVLVAVGGPAHSSKTSRLNSDGDTQAKKNHSTTVKRDTADPTKQLTVTDASRSRLRPILDGPNWNWPAAGAVLEARSGTARREASRAVLPEPRPHQAARWFDPRSPRIPSNTAFTRLAFAPTSSSREIEDALARRRAIQGRRRDIDPSFVGDPGAPIPVNNEDLIREALAHRGTPYRWGGASRGGFDCSGFALYIYRRTRGMNLPHSAAAMSKIGAPVARRDLRPGDLVFFRKRRGIGHVAIYVGDNRIVHAANYKKRVIVESLTGWYDRRYAGARRLSPAPEWPLPEDRAPPGTVTVGNENDGVLHLASPPQPRN